MPARPPKHQPYRLSSYIRIVGTVVNQFRSRGFVDRDTIDFYPLSAGWLQVLGEIACLGRIIIQVDKILQAIVIPSDDPEVQTMRYSYNVSVHGQGTKFRYDNAKHHLRGVGHHDEHHRHDFDDHGRELAGSPTWIGADRWPHLGDVITEAEQWYYDHRTRLHLPEEYPPIRRWGGPTN